MSFFSQPKPQPPQSFPPPQDTPRQLDNERFVLVPESKVSKPTPRTVFESKKAPLRSREAKRRVGGRRGRRAARGLTGPQPRDLNTTPTCRATYRYGLSSAITMQAVNPKTCVGAIGGICTVASTTLVPWASSFRVREVRVFPPAEASSISVRPAAVQWYGAVDHIEKDDRHDQTMPYGVSGGSLLRSRPPKASLARDWIISESANPTIFAVTADPGSIVEVDFEWTLVNSLVPQNSTIASGALGSTYYLALDGPTSNKLVPLGRPTTS